MNNEIVPGLKVGKWTVIVEAPKDHNMARGFHCVCECGNRQRVNYASLKGGHDARCRVCNGKKESFKTVDTESGPVTIYTSKDKNGVQPFDQKYNKAQFKPFTEAELRTATIEIGAKFGKWTVIADSLVRGSYKCQCECGYQRIMSKVILLKGRILRCRGCAAQTKAEEKGTAVMMNQKFGLWTITGRIFLKGKHFYYPCRCECGLEKPLAHNTLVNGNSMGCKSCRAKERVKHYPMPTYPKKPEPPPAPVIQPAPEEPKKEEPISTEQKRYGYLVILNKVNEDFCLVRCENCKRELTLAYSALSEGLSSCFQCTKKDNRDDIYRKNIGKKYGKWTIINYERNTRGRYYHVQCECEVRRLVAISDLHNGKTNSCMRCSQTKGRSLRPGDKIHHWTILSYSETDRGKYNCRCELCGNVYVRYGGVLRANRTTACSNCSNKQRVETYKKIKFHEKAQNLHIEEQNQSRVETMDNKSRIGKTQIPLNTRFKPGDMSNKWKIIRYIGGNKGAYLCLCTVCNKEYEVRGHNLITGHSKQCINCYRKYFSKYLQEKKAIKHSEDKRLQQTITPVEKSLGVENINPTRLPDIGKKVGNILSYASAGVTIVYFIMRIL